MLPSEPSLARGIQAERDLAAAGGLFVFSTMHKQCDFHRQGFCLAEELALWCLGEALDGFRPFSRSLVLSVGCVNMGVSAFS